jgi:hypothetical protein
LPCRQEETTQNFIDLLPKSEINGLRSDPHTPSPFAVKPARIILEKMRASCDLPCVLNER